MRVFYLGPITDDVLFKKLSDEIKEKILSYDKVFSKRQRRVYEIKNKLDRKYLEHVKGITNEIGDFIRDFLPRFYFSSQRGDFDYVRKYRVEFLNRHELLVKVRVKTDKEEKELLLDFDLPSSVYLPGKLFRVKGQYVYIYSHLDSRISFVIGNRENPKTDDWLIDDALEELWHLAIYPYLVEKFNRNLRKGVIKPESGKSEMVREGEFLAKALSSASFDEFKGKKKYDIPTLSKVQGPDQQTRDEEKILADKIKKIGIKKALKEISRGGISPFWQ